MTITLLIALFTATAASAWTPTREQLKDRRQTVQTIRQSKCLNVRALPRLEFGLPGIKLLRRYLVWGERKERVKGRESQCVSAAAWAWHNGSAASCVRSHEGGLQSVNPAGPYYGWYQTDASFQAAYGPEWYRIYGPGIWPAEAQVVTAYRGWQARGWAPWPNTAAMCGLL